MTDLTLSFVPEAGQVIGQGPPAGAAGAGGVGAVARRGLAPPAGAAGSAGLVPVPGLELAFDSVDGRLTSVVVDLTRADELTAVDEITLDERVAALLTRLFGAQAPTLLLNAVGAPPGQSPDARLRSPEPDVAA